jgi:DNA-binding response OmpR family regulator
MRVLIVEDEDKLVQIIARGLKAEGYAVDSASDGTQGLEFATAFAYDAIVLDIMLPGISGSDLLAAIRQRNRAVPILMLTAKDAVAEKVKHMETWRLTGLHASCGAPDSVLN